MYLGRVPNMFSMVESKPHSTRKRMVSHIYSKSFLQSSPELHKISRLILFGRLLPLLSKAAIDEQPLDVLEINYSSAMDFITAFIFGLQNGTNFLQEAMVRRHWFENYQRRRRCKPPLVSFSSASSFVLTSSSPLDLSYLSSINLSNMVSSRPLLERRASQSRLINEQARYSHCSQNGTSYKLRNRGMDIK